MAAYFNLSMQFQRKNIYHTFVKDFYGVLEDVGMKFKSGFWGFEGDSLEEIIEWNQEKLEQNFCLGYTQHHKHDYKQVVYDFYGFSEARGFWMNQYPEGNAFTYEFIVPEDEVVSYKCSGKQLLEDGSLCEVLTENFLEEQVNILLTAAKKIWQFPYVCSIQTGLEASSASAGLTELDMGGIPNIQPFAIVEETSVAVKESKCLAIPMEGRKGILFRRRR